MELRLEPALLEAPQPWTQEYPASAEITESLEGKRSDGVWICKFFISDFLCAFGLDIKVFHPSFAIENSYYHDLGVTIHGV
jgi:hypothetical protein